MSSFTVEDLIMFAREQKASDIHLTVGAPTVFRINGKLERLEDIDDEVVSRTILSMLSADQEKALRAGQDLDFSMETSDGSRQRVNVFRQMGKIAASIRLLNSKVPSFAELGLPTKLMSDLCTLQKGLVLVTGATGSGKSTTMAAMVNHINKTRPVHILTIEDPVEYKYAASVATIHQREIGADVDSFDGALRSALREDPDVILVGEMRDYETISLAITAAETGHLVIASLHTTNAPQTIDRIIDVFPTNSQGQVRSQLSMLLKAVISQILVPTRDGKGRVAALEILLGNDAVANMIRTEKGHQLPSLMSNSKSGMCLMNDSLRKLFQTGKISRADALEYSPNRPNLEEMIGGVAAASGGIDM